MIDEKVDSFIHLYLNFETFNLIISSNIALNPSLNILHPGLHPIVG